MKSSLEAPDKQVSEETSAKPQKQVPASVIDTSKMSKGKREALELAEASRDPLDERGRLRSRSGISRQSGKISARKYRRRRDRSHRRNSAEEHRRSFRDGRFRSQNSDAIRRPRFIAGQLRAGCHVARKLGRKSDRARFRAPVHWRSATAASFWHGRAKEKVSSAGRATRDFGLCLDRMECWLRSGEHEFAGGRN